MSDPEQLIVDEAVAKLLEHFDSVKIFVTRHDGDKQATDSYDAGGGNLYAQLGQIHEYLAYQDQYARDVATHNRIAEEEDDKDPEPPKLTP